MANFFEGAGRSGALARATSNLRETAFGIRQQNMQQKKLDILEEQADVSNAINREQLVSLQQENKQKKTMVPMNIALQAFDTPEVREYAYKKAKAMGYIEEVAPGQEGIRVGNAETFMNAIMDPRNQYIEEISNLRLNSITNNLAKVEQALAEEKNPKKKQELLMAKRQLQQKHMQVFNATKQVGEYKELLKEGYEPATIDQYIKTGDRSVLEVRPDVKEKDSNALTKNQVLTQTRQFYGQRAKQYLDPLTGFVKEGLEEQHEALMKRQDQDLARINAGKIPRWMQGAAEEPPEEIKQLDEKTAREYLKKAGGDIEKARMMAKEDGYDF